MRELLALNKYFWKYKYLLLAGTFFIVLSKVFAVFQAPLVRKSLNLITSKLTSSKSQMGEVTSELAEFGLLMVGAALVSGFFLYLTRQTIIVMSRKMEYDLKNEIFEHYQTLPLSFFRKRATGDLMARISEDVGKVRMYLGPGVMYSISLAVICITVIGTMVSVNSRLTLVVLLPLPFLSIAIYFVSNRLNRYSEKIQQEMSKLSSFGQESFSGMRVIKSFAKERFFKGKMEARSDAYLHRALKLARIQSAFFPVIILLIGASTLLTVAFGGYLSISSDGASFSAGNIAEFVIYLNMLTWPVTSIGWVTSIIQTAAASQKRINEFLNTKTDLVYEEELKVDIDGGIKFENVSVTYEESGCEALKQVSFEVKRGETVAIVGGTGSGKSTIADLLCRAFDPNIGRILIGDNDLKDINLSYYRDQIGYVPQDPFLFSDSIKNNLLFGNSQASQEDIKKATKLACVYDNIDGFTNKFDTVLGERGITISGGQKQRLTIARALIKDPELLILDDSLSAVDTETENRILQNLEKLMQGKTAVLISHRVSSVKLADKIAVLDNGSLKEYGTHDELYANKGAYFDIYNKQLQES